MKYSLYLDSIIELSKEEKDDIIDRLYWRWKYKKTYVFDDINTIKAPRQKKIPIVPNEEIVLDNRYISIPIDIEEWKTHRWTTYIKRYKRKTKKSYRPMQSKIRKLFEHIKYCMNCWSNVWLCVHHKDKNKNNNDVSNLEKICLVCHMKKHEWENVWKIMNKRLHSI